MRRTLGDAIKLNLDDLLISQHFRDKDRKFRVEDFAFRVQPLVDSLMADEELDTSMYSKDELMEMAVDIAKHRDSYKPKKKLSSTAKKRKRIAKHKKNKAIRKTAAAAAAAAASAAVADGDRADADDDRSDDDAVLACAPALATHTPATEEQSDPDDLLHFLQLDKQNQRDRAADKKTVTREKTKAKERRRKATLEEENAEAPAKKDTRLARKKEREKAAAEAHLDYSRKMAAIAVRESRKKSKARKKAIDARKLEETVRLCALEVGMRVSGQWTDEQGKGDWYEGVVESIDFTNRTVFIKYDDGDTDDAVPWENTRIIDQAPTDGWRAYMFLEVADT